MSIPSLYRQLNTYLVCFLLVAGLYGCGVSTEDRPPANSPSNIHFFTLLGNMGDEVGAITQHINLDRHSNNDAAAGYFDMSWDVQSSDPYTVTAHISSDASTGFGIDDLIILSAQCGSDELLYTCEFSGDQRCAVAYEPDYSYVTDIDGNQIRQVDPGPDAILGTSDDFFVVLADRYYIRCPHGGASISEAEITLKMLGAGFPATSLNQYIVFTVCNQANDSCDYELINIEVLDANP